MEGASIHGRISAAAEFFLIGMIGCHSYSERCFNWNDRHAASEENIYVQGSTKRWALRCEKFLPGPALLLVHLLVDLSLPMISVLGRRSRLIFITRQEREAAAQR